MLSHLSNAIYYRLDCLQEDCWVLRTVDKSYEAYVDFIHSPFVLVCVKLLCLKFDLQWISAYEWDLYFDKSKELVLFEWGCDGWQVNQ